VTNVILDYVLMTAIDIDKRLRPNLKKQDSEKRNSFRKLI